ncbi:hypothetical protein ASG91_09115 [Phycicoccus sp. Soil802]|nr:hypothetical protein ASG91_09115 [Phycicoccus sp. Soil802]
MALLLANAGHALTRDQLVDGVWGDDIPATAANVLQVYVSQLRKALGRDLIQTEGQAYRLVPGSTRIDVDEFVSLISSGRQELDDGDPALASEHLSAALGLWRGSPYEDVADTEALGLEISRLEELRLNASEAWFDAQLACGRHAELLPELLSFTKVHPLREHVWAQLMRAQYALGRQADALSSFRAARNTLRDELGVEPGPELQGLHHAVLDHDSTLALGHAVELPPLPAELSVPGPRFVGREAELSALLASLVRAEAGPSEVFVLEGPEGSGKTRLAAELSRIARARNVRTSYASGTEVLSLTGVDEVPSLLVADDVERLTGAAAPELASLVGRVRPRTLLVMLYDASEAAMPVRVVLASAHAGPVQERRLDELTVPESLTVCRLYDPDASEADIRAFVGSLHDRWPRRIHELASEWAVGRAKGRAHEAAAGFSAPMAALSRAQDDLVDTLSEVAHAQRTRSTVARSGPRLERPPYVGMRPYTAHEQAIFFGREALVGQLLAELVAHRVVLVAGPSGSGKSSVVMAGVLPCLAAGALPDSDRWTVHPLVPSAVSPGQLDEILAEADAGQPLLLLLDQLEEVFTAIGDPSPTELGRCLDTLVRNPNVRVISTLRTDFLDRCATWGLVGPRLVEATSHVSPMHEAELRQVVEQPAVACGLRLEPGLVNRILTDAGDAPGILPLLSTALRALWERRSGDKLTHQAYQEAGGVRAAINNLAEDTYESLTDDGRAAARRMLLRLAEADTDVGYVRRRAAITELAPEQDAIGRHVLDALTARRLVVVDRDTVEVSHEALLTEWARLRGWLDEDLEGRAILRHLGPTAVEWDATGRSPGDLYRGPRLALAEEFATTHDRDLTPLEREFVSAGVAAATAEAGKQRRSLRRLRTLVAALAAVVAVTAGTAVVATDQRNKATTARAAASAAAVHADARRLAAAALLEPQADRALLMAAQAQRLEDNADTRAALFTLLRQDEALTRVVTVSDKGLGNVAVSPNGQLVATATTDGVTLFDQSLNRRITTLVVPESSDMAFSPDSLHLAVIGERGARVFDMQRPTASPDVLPVENWINGHLAFTKDGGRLVVAGFRTGSEDGEGGGWSVSTWDVKTHRLVATLLTGIRLDGPRAVTVLNSGVVAVDAGDGSALLRADGTAVLKDLEGSQVTNGVGELAVAVSPDGTTVATADASGSLRLLDGTTLQTREERASTAVRTNALSFSPDGQRLAVAGDDGTIRLWTTRPLQLSAEFTGHGAPVNDLAFTRDSANLISAGSEGSLIRWSLTRTNPLAKPLVLPAAPKGFSHQRADFRTSPPGSPLLGVVSFANEHPSGPDDTIQTDAWVWCGVSQLTCTPTFLPGESIDSASTDADRNRVLVQSSKAVTGIQSSSTWRVYDRGGRTIAQAQTKTVGGGRLTPDGTQIAGPSDSGDVVFWDTNTLKPLPRRYATGLKESFGVSAFSPDGRFMAVNTFAGDLLILDLANKGHIHELARAPGPPGGLAFSPDGRLVAAGLLDGHIRLWQTSTWTEITGRLGNHHGQIGSIAFATDSRTLITTASDDVIIWNLTSDSPAGTHLKAPAQRAATPVDATHLLTQGDNASALLWTLDPADWIAAACSITGRDLTAAEWHQISTTRPQTKACNPTR